MFWGSSGCLFADKDLYYSIQLSALAKWYRFEIFSRSLPVFFHFFWLIFFLLSSFRILNASLNGESSPITSRWKITRVKTIFGSFSREKLTLNVKIVHADSNDMECLWHSKKFVCLFIFEHVQIKCNCYTSGWTFQLSKTYVSFILIQ